MPPARENPVAAMFTDRKRAPDAAFVGRAERSPPRSARSRSQPQRIGEAGEDLDQVDLPVGARLLEEVLEVRLDRRLRNAEDGGDRGNSAYLDDRRQHAKLGRRELVALGHGLDRRGQVERRLADKDRCHRLVDKARGAAGPGGQAEDMGDELFAIPGGERHADAPGRDRCVAGARNRENAGKGQGAVGIGGRQQPFRLADDIRLGKHCGPARVGEDDRAPLVDEEDAGGKPVERIGKRRRFQLVQAEDLPDQDRAPEVRRQQLHAPDRFVVDETLADIAADRNRGHARRGPVERRGNQIRVALRRQPLLEKARRAQFLVGHQLRSGEDLARLHHHQMREDRIDLGVFLEIEAGIFLVVAPAEEEAAVAVDVMEIHDRRDAADEAGRRFEDGGPNVRIERGVVDFADQCRERLELKDHVDRPRRLGARRQGTADEDASPSKSGYPVRCRRPLAGVEYSPPRAAAQAGRPSGGSAAHATFRRGRAQITRKSSPVR